MKLLSLSILIAILCALPSLANANRAGVVVMGQNGQSKEACVSFDENTINSIELLKRAGFKPILQNGFVVSINEEEAKSFNDFGSGNDYWSFWSNDNTGWHYSRVGGASKQVKDEEVDGWQRGGSDLRLKEVQFSNICPNQTKPALITQTIPTTTSNKMDKDAPPEHKGGDIKPKIESLNTATNEADSKPAIQNKPINKTEKVKQKENKLNSETMVGGVNNIIVIPIIFLTTILTSFITLTLIKRMKAG